MLHGFLEHGHVWKEVAPEIARAGHRVLALDWRGHGDSDWVGPGGYYHFADYVADLAALVRQLGGSAALVAHSMGGNAAVLYAGTEPERVWGLVSIEGLGPPDSDPAAAPGRFAEWIADVERVGERGRPRFSLEQAIRRLCTTYARLDDSALRALALQSTREEDGERTWKFDPLHQTRSPQPYYARQGAAFWRRVRCPVLYVQGTDSPFRLAEPDLAERLTALRAERAVIEGSGHHPHLEKPRELAAMLVQFLSAARPAA